MNFMKMQAIKSNTPLILNIFVFSSFLFITSLPCRANKNAVWPGSGKEDKTADVKYIGSLNGQHVYDVMYTNNSGARFSVRVKDGEGNLIFNGSYTDKIFEKKFMLAGGVENDKLVFTITNSGDNSIQSFEVNTSSRLVEEVEVKELN